jgi:hypothetical protein
MAALDIFHDVVVHALEKDGWRITHDPLTIPFAGTYVEIDLGAAKLIAAEKGDERIGVEVKSFAGASHVSEFHTALGQYLDYEEALRRYESERVLFLAIPVEIHQTLFAEEMIRTILQRYAVKLLIFDPQAESIVSWIKSRNTDELSSN